MRLVLFCHSLRADWNNGHAHFLRGVTTELVQRGHEVEIYETHRGWSRQNQLAEAGGRRALREVRRYYPEIVGRTRAPADPDLERILDGADLVIVHEWNDPARVRAIGAARARLRRPRLLFHDTHHRAATDPAGIARYDLRHYDGVLAFGAVVRDLYLARGWAQRAWVWHEAADTRVFRPRPDEGREGDLVWIGNWGDDERTAELAEFLFGPAHDLGLRCRVHGVRYPDAALRMLARTGIDYRGWLPNFRVPQAFAQHRVTVHVPRRPYVEALPGIPTIRPFEAMACGIPLVCAPWRDDEGLFEAGRDYLLAADGAEMRRHLRALLADADMAREFADHALATINARHTCAHRVDELLAICAGLGLRTVEAPEYESMTA